MSAFDTLARPVILAASRATRLQRAVERLPVTRRVVRRFVPGETVEAVLAAVADLRASRRLVSIDHLQHLRPLGVVIGVDRQHRSENFFAQQAIAWI